MRRHRTSDAETRPAIGPSDGFGEGGQPRPGYRRRRRRAVPIGAGAAIAVVVVVVGALGVDGGGSEGSGSELPRAGATVQVSRDTLVDAATVDGELNHGPEIPLGVKGPGTVTWLPADGTIVRRGETLLRIDDRPVVLLYGKLPMYRGLAAASTDNASPTTSADDVQADVAPAPGDTPRPPGGSPEPQSTPPPEPAEPAPAAKPFHGRDVRQFESNLKALRYSGFTVDETYTATTTKAVKRWQKDLGIPMTGAVGVGDVIYTSGPVRVAHALVRVGAEASGDVLNYTGTTRMVTVDAPAGGMAWAVRGVKVNVNLPDRRSVSGKVTSVGRETTSAQEPDAGAQTGDARESDTSNQPGGNSQNPTVPVIIDVPDQRKLGRWERSPVTVEYVVGKRENVLTVPVSALVALAEGGYGVEVVEGRSSRFVAVQTGLFADGRVEISGTAIRAGTAVRIPQ